MAMFDPYRDLRPTRQDLLGELRSALVATRAENEALRRELTLARRRPPAPAPAVRPVPAPAPEYPPAPAPPDPTAADDRVTRLTADLANVRRVRDEQIARARSEERAAGVLALASVRDDLERALDTNPDRGGPWDQGLRAILASLDAALRRAGASAVGEPGDPFDARIHEAVSTGPGPEGTLIAVHQRGYRLDDGTLVRPARVAVAG
ncbi:MAG: nucleotide exchange factor GrpE [Myxococcota bacterium]